MLWFLKAPFSRLQRMDYGGERGSRETSEEAPAEGGGADGDKGLHWEYSLKRELTRDLLQHTHELPPLGFSTADSASLSGSPQKAWFRFSRDTELPEGSSQNSFLSCGF